MPADTSLERRVSRLENDTTSVYDLITDIRSVQQDHGRRLDGIDGRLEGIQTTLQEVVRRLPEPA